MPRVKIASDAAEPASVNIEVARLRDLDVKELRAHWETAWAKKAPAHLPRHLLLRVLAYRLQAERLGDLDAESRRLLDQSASPEQASRRAAEANKRTKQIEARYGARSRVERPRASCCRDGGRLRLERQHLRKSIQSSVCNNWHPMEWATLLRAPR